MTGIDTSLRGVLYVDADWLEPSGSATTGIAIVDGRLFWNDAPHGAVSAEGVDGAAALLVEYSRRIATAVGAGPSLDVVGSGALADLVRRQLRGSALRASAPPDAIAVLTSDPRAVVAALHNLADLGALVLGCPTNPGGPLDLYGDLHRRGLHIIGVPRPQPGLASEAETDAPLLREAVSWLVDIAPPAVELPRCGWFRLTRGTT